MDLNVYGAHPHVRDLFVELATEAALHGREAGLGVTLREREPLSKSTIQRARLI